MLYVLSLKYQHRHQLKHILLVLSLMINLKSPEPVSP